MESKTQRRYIQLRDLLVALDLAPTVESADKLVAGGRVRVCGSVAKSPNMTVLSDETDVVLGPRQQGSVQSIEVVEERMNESAVLVSIGGLVSKRFAVSESTAQKLIIGGLVLSEGTPETNPAAPVDPQCNVTLAMAPAWHWLVHLHGMSEADAKSAISGQRVITLQGKVIDAEEELVSSVGISTLIFPNSSNAYLKSSGGKYPTVFRPTQGSTVEAKLITIADVMVQLRLAKSHGHASYLCASGRVRVAGKESRDPLTILEADQSISVSPTSTESPSTKELEMMQLVESISKLAGEGERLDPLKVRKFIQSSGGNETQMAIAIAEFGADNHLTWSPKLGICCRPRAGKVRSGESKVDDGANRGAPVHEKNHEEVETHVREDQDAHKGDEIVALSNEESRKLEVEDPARVQIALLKALCESRLAVDEDDARLLIAAGVVLVAGERVQDPDAVVSPESVDIENRVRLMRRAIPRALEGSIDAFAWPHAEQRELLWTLMATSCFICNVALEAFACGAKVDATDAMSLFLSQGDVYESCKATESMLRGASRVIIERACNEAFSRWATPQPPGYAYKKKPRRANEFILTPSSEYFWPLIGMYSDENKLRETVESFYGGEQDERKRKRLASVLLDLTMYVTDDSLLLSDKNKSLSVDAHSERLQKLADVRGLAESPWHLALLALV